MTDKPTDMEIDTKGTDYIDEDPMVLMLKGERTRWKPPTIVEATTELKHWAWEGAAHPMEEFSMNIKTVEPITLAKNIVSIPIESVFASITIPVESVCDRSPIESVTVEFVENSFPYKYDFNSSYFWH